MGGNALKTFGVETRRVPASEFKRIEQEVIKKIQYRLNAIAYTLNAEPLLKVCGIPFVRAKRSFGDLDIVVETRQHIVIDWQSMLHMVFKPRVVVCSPINVPEDNPNRKNLEGVWSFDYEDFQVDILLTPSEDYESTVNYYAYNDAGNLAGLIYKRMGFKYGNRGLLYYVRDEANSTHVLEEIVVCKDVGKILEFIGLDAQEFQAGFATFEDMFRWIQSSPFYSPEIYLLENRDAKNRARDRKRSTYKMFLEWIYKTPAKPSQEPTGEVLKLRSLQRALKFFKDFDVKHCRVLFLAEQNKRAKAVYNGEVVSRITGYKNNELGLFMAFVSNSMGGRNRVRAAMCHLSDWQVEERIKELHKSYLDKGIA